MAYTLEHAELGRNCHVPAINLATMSKARRQDYLKAKVADFDRQLRDIIPDSPLFDILSHRRMLFFRKL